MIPIYPQRPDTLCRYAWDYLMFYISEPSFTYCCRTLKRTRITDEMCKSLGQDLFSNLPEHVERRKSLLSNVQHNDCHTCWQLENKGFESSRNDYMFEKYMERNTGFEPQNKEDLKNIPNLTRSTYASIIEIVLNNTCDAKCTYCSEHYSTQWYAEKKKYNIPMTRDTSQLGERKKEAEKLFWEWYKTTGIKHLTRFGFIGGEPLITDLLYECLDKLIEIHSNTVREPTINLSNDTTVDKIELCITTNMNTPPSYFNKFLNYLPILNQYFNVIVQVSGENIGEELEYIRYGVKWDRFKNNLETLLSKPDLVKINFMPCLNLLGLPSFYKYVEYFAACCKKYYPIDIHRNIVTWPKEQSPTIAPREYAAYLDQPLQIFNELINDPQFEGQSVINVWKEFLFFLKQTQDAIKKNQNIFNMFDKGEEVFVFFTELDDRRNTNFLKTFPEFKVWLDG
jgi:hypothetical protein